jgi:hypothetical protein
MEHSQETIRLNPDHAMCTTAWACEMARSSMEAAMVEKFRIRLQLYRDRKPYHEPIRTSSDGGQTASIAHLGISLTRGLRIRPG